MPDGSTVSACATTTDGSTCGSTTRRWSRNRSSTAARVGHGPTVVRHLAGCPTDRVHSQRARVRSAVCRRGRHSDDRRGRPRRARPALVAGRPAGRAAIGRAHTDPGGGLRRLDMGAQRRGDRSAERLGGAATRRARPGGDRGRRWQHAPRPAVPRRRSDRSAVVLAARRPDRPVAGHVHAAHRLLALAGLERARARSPWLDRPRARLPAGAAWSLGRARRQRRRRRDHPCPRAGLGLAGAHGDRRIVCRRVHRARRRRVETGVWSPP